MHLSRRAFLAGTTAAVIVVAGTAEVIANNDLDLLRTTLDRMLGDVRISDAELGRFVDMFASTWTGFEGYRGPLRKLSEFSGLASIADAFPAIRPDYVERYERLLVTRYLVWTDHVDAAASGRSAVFVGPAACQNPFATFTFD
ncbi:MAG: twin-arginine translocation signal domain-containing protein [Microvirga sp.]